MSNQFVLFLLRCLCNSFDTKNSFFYFFLRFFFYSIQVGIVVNTRYRTVKMKRGGGKRGRRGAGEGKQRIII